MGLIPVEPQLNLLRKIDGEGETAPQELEDKETPSHQSSNLYHLKKHSGSRSTYSSVMDIVP